MADSLRDRLHRAVCDCGAADGDCARADDALAVVAEWLREKAAQTQTASDLLPASQEIEVRAIARMLRALARSITESTEEPR